MQRHSRPNVFLCKGLLSGEMIVPWARVQIRTRASQERTLRANNQAKRTSRGRMPNSLGVPPALPGWQQEFDIFGSVLHSFVKFEQDVHVHEHVNVYVNVDVDVDGDR